MMRKIFLIGMVCFFSFNVFAEIGSVTKVHGAKDAYLKRGAEKLLVTESFLLEEGDEIFAENSFVVILIHPSTQISVARGTNIVLSEAKIEESENISFLSSAIKLIKGVIRAQVIKDTNLEVEQKIVSGNVTFGVRGTEFEVSSENDDVELDVVEGAVEVSSPDVHSFVPEIIKSNQGLKFNRKLPRFERKVFALKFKEHPGFLPKEKIKEIWIVQKEKIKHRIKKRLKRIQERRENTDLNSSTDPAAESGETDFSRRNRLSKKERREKRFEKLQEKRSSRRSDSITEDQQYSSRKKSNKKTRN